MNVTGYDVLQAIRSCDEMGLERFLEVHGFGPSRLYDSDRRGPERQRGARPAPPLP